MRRGAWLLLLGFAACAQQTTERQVNVATRMSVDQTSCFCGDPDGCPLDCGGAVGLFALDPDAPDTPPGANVLASKCVTFSPHADDKLRMLQTHLAGTSFQFPEGTRLVLQLIVYPSSAEMCPPPVLNEDGTLEPTPGMQTPMYAARSLPQTLEGDQVIFDLDIGCPTSFPSCPTSTHKMQAYVRNLSTSTLLSGAEGQAFDVHAAALSYAGGVPVEAELTPIAGLALQAGSPDALFEATSETGFGFPADCMGTIVTHIPPNSPSTVSCEGQYGETQILAQSYYVEKNDIDDITADLGLTAELPDGLVIGRISVIGPQLDVYTVLPHSGTADVAYYDRDGTTGHLVRRPASGHWFAVTNAAFQVDPPSGAMSTDPAPVRCCERFDAVNSAGDAVGTTWAPVGQIKGVVMATELTVVEPGM